MVKLIIYVGGPSGCGKSTIGEILAKELGCKFLEGDSYHPIENINKMSQGIPLKDDDRWDWLKRLTLEACKVVFETSDEFVVVSCSILKKKYRGYIKEVVVNGCCSDVQTFSVFLNNDFDIIHERMKARGDHFMKSEMLKSQFADMEIPSTQEAGVVGVYCGTKTQDEISEQVLRLTKEYIKQKSV
ncbi:hypothetical protein CANARDRAFT_6503 [[Candida] arabinofermentans NRRL YB-2248]|uniref:Gluconokinase n=1 Tax=[Candida] arabinofermentans NRRL YB-2248 TaxID=983967 RepID=A0A1E4T5B5_9ASCO|nr:hypothetical protein CANARDRAFT_6503 [[Candida] arabinofermentans NRRL YB-2248]